MDNPEHEIDMSIGKMIKILEDKSTQALTNDPRNSDLTKDEDINKAFDASERPDSPSTASETRPNTNPMPSRYRSQPLSLNVKTRQLLTTQD